MPVLPDFLISCLPICSFLSLSELALNYENLKEVGGREGDRSRENFLAFLFQRAKEPTGKLEGLQRKEDYLQV